MSSELGKVVYEARIRAGLSRKQLGSKVDYTEVMIGKIERGDRALSEARLHRFADELHVPIAELREAFEKDGGSRGLKVATAVQLARANASRAKSLQQEAEALTDRASTALQEVREAITRFQDDVIAEVDKTFSAIEGIPDDILELELQSVPDQDAKGFEFLEELQAGGLRGEMLKLLKAGALGGGVGATAGGAAAAATYLSVATWGVASTGTAIAGLRGIAATNATLAAIGGGALSAGGLGIAGGTAMLAGIIALPIVAIAGLAIAASGSKALSKQREVEASLEKAAASLAHDQVVIDKFVTRVADVDALLSAARFSARKHMARIRKGMEREIGTVGDGRISWVALSNDAQASARRMATVVVTCAIVLALPLAPRPRGDGTRLEVASDGTVDLTDGFEAGSLYPGDPEVESAIDLALEEAALQLAP